VAGTGARKRARSQIAPFDIARTPVRRRAIPSVPSAAQRARWKSATLMGTRKTPPPSISRGLAAVATCSVRIVQMIAAALSSRVLNLDSPVHWRTKAIAVLTNKSGHITRRSLASPARCDQDGWPQRNTHPSCPLFPGQPLAARQSNRAPFVRTAHKPFRAFFHFPAFGLPAEFRRKQESLNRQASGFSGMSVRNITASDVEEDE
jgi:hypothetical protein